MGAEQWKLPEPGERFGPGRVRCCREDHGGSHYHCPACGSSQVSMYGHVSGTPSVRSCTGTELPDAFGSLMAVTGPFDGPAPWEAAT